MTEIKVGDDALKKIDRGLSFAKKFSIQKKDDMVLAGEFLKRLAGIRKNIVDTFLVPKKKASDAHKSICSAEKKHLEPVLLAENLIRKKMGDYQVERDRELLQIKVEEEKKERDWLIIENQKKIKLEEREKLSVAEKLKKEGKQEEAEKLIASPVKTKEIGQDELNLVYVKKQEVENATGIQYRENWRFEILDAKKIPSEYLVVDEKKIRKIVRSLRGETNISGVRVFCEKTPVVGGRK